MEMTMNEEKCIDVLSTLLTENIPVSHFAIGHSMDSAVCILKENGFWHVFYGDRNDRAEEAVYASVFSACIDMIHRLAYPENEERYVSELGLAMFGKKIA